MHYWFFSDWSRQSQTHPSSFKLSRFIRLRQAVGNSKVYYCIGWAEGVFWSVSQGSDCLWIQVARAKWQHPGATACNRSGNDLREYNKVLPHPPPWPTALITLALNLYFISKRHPNSQVDGRYGVWVKLAAWNVLQGINIRLVKWTITIDKTGFNICFFACIAWTHPMSWKQVMGNDAW